MQEIGLARACVSREFDGLNMPYIWMLRAWAADGEKRRENNSFSVIKPFHFSCTIKVKQLTVI